PGDTLDDDVVIAGCGVVGARHRVLLTRLRDLGDGELYEGVVGARLLARRGHLERRVRVGGMRIAEALEAGQLPSQGIGRGPLGEALRLGSKQRVEIQEAEAGHRAVGGRGDDADAVDPYLELD